MDGNAEYPRYRLEDDDMSEYTIKVKISDETELYNGYDPDGLTLNEGMLDYIKSFSSKCRKADRVLIEFVSSIPLNEDNLRMAFKIMLDNEAEKLKQEKMRNNIKQLWMFGIGCLFILVGILLGSHVGELTAVILSTIGSFSLWEAAAIWIVENPKNRLKQRWVTGLKKTELIIKNTQ